MSYRQPFTGDWPITQHFGETVTDPAGHTGIDYACPIGTSILASEEGTVILAGWDNTGYGNMVVVRHPDLNVSIYAHLSLISVKVSQKVRQGEKIGESGNTGNSTGPHLHFEMRGPDGKPFDPAKVLMTVDDSIKPVENAEYLKEARDLERRVMVVAPLGAKAWDEDFMKYDVFLQGEKLYFTGRTQERNGITFCEVHPAPRSYWVAVHDGETQILDNRQ